jgi:mutual gliding-motility protein MglA
VQLDFVNRELTVKLVYYGPALSGKTTNLLALHQAARPGASGRLMTLETRDDRTLFFDLLPLRFKGHGGLSVRLKVFTVPGQVIHAATRRLVVQGADGIAFIADSRVTETDHNTESFLDLKHNLKEHGLELQEMPLIIQFNKRDMPGVRTDAELAELASRGREPVYLAVATSGMGVVESFVGLLHLTMGSLNATHDLEKKFGFDLKGLLAEVTEKLGRGRDVPAILGACVGGALDVLVPEAAEP